MYDVRLITDDMEAYRGYISPDIYDGFSSMSNRFLAAAYDGGRTAGVCVFDAANVTSIAEVSITGDCRDRKLLRRDLLRFVLGICEKLQAEVVTLSLYDEDDFDEWEPVLDEFRFELDEQTEFYRFMIDSLYKSPLIAKLKNSKSVVPYEEADDKLIGEFDEYLKDAGLFEDLTHDRIRRDLSSVYIRDGRIEGVLLISNITDGICVEYAYVSGHDANGLAGLIHRTVNAIAADRTLSETAVGELACINERSDKLFLKMLPDHEKLGEQRTYYTVLAI